MNETPRYREHAVVRGQRALGGGYQHLVLEAPEVARAARPGHFALLGVRPEDEPGSDPLLPRPFSFLRRSPTSGEVELFYRVVGRGTALMQRWREGDRVPLLGPLGQPWPEPTAGRVVLVAGGVGMPPLLDLAESLQRRRPELEVHVCYGGRSSEHLHFLERFDEAAVTLHLSTDDGSVGRRGTNVEALAALLADGEAGEVFACGPGGMLEAAAREARRGGARCWVSLEAPMACGVGVCRGCAVPSGEGYKMVCADGPVFDGAEVYP